MLFNIFFGNKIVIGLTLLLAIISGSFYLHYKNSRDTILSLQENVSKLDIVVKTQNETIKVVQESLTKQLQLATELQIGLAKAEEDRDKLASLLRKHNLEKILRDRPSAAERKINDGTSRTFRQIEKDTLSK